MSCRPVGRWCFGKLPAQGDFVWRGLDDYALRDGIDRWLAAGLKAAQAAFPDFRDRYDHAPAWNFVDRDGDGRWSGGALCASVDRVGRRYPMIMAAPAQDAAEAAALSGACLDALAEALTAGWDAQSLHEAPLVPTALSWRPEASEWALLGEDGPPGYTVTERYPKDVVSVMLELAS